MTRYLAIFENGHGYIQGAVVNGDDWIDAAERWGNLFPHRLVALSQAIGPNGPRDGATLQFYNPEYESKVIGGDAWIA